MKVMSKFFYTLFISAIIFSCSDDDGPTIFSSEQAAAKALEMVSGQVVSTELDSAGTDYEWDVKVMTDGGSEVEFEFDQATGTLLEISGDEGPFSYEVNPGLGLVPFSQARDAALGTVTNGEISGWELEQDAQGNWVYEFEVISDGQSEMVAVDAATGTVI